MSGFEIYCFGLVAIGVILLIVELYWRNQPNYAASLKIPGEYIYPIIGNLMEVIFVNSSKCFKAKI